MARDFKVYKCPHCGNIVTLLHVGGGTLVCCGEPMKLLVAGENDTAAKEKHVPVVATETGKVIVKVGEVPHPMTEEHLIQWVALVTDTQVYFAYLAPGEEPKAEFSIDVTGTSYEVYEYCNLHGLWKA